MSKNSYSVTKNHKQYEVDHYSWYHCMIINCSVGHYSVGHYMTIYSVEHYVVDWCLTMKNELGFYLGYYLNRIIISYGEKKDIAEI